MHFHGIPFRHLFGVVSKMLWKKTKVICFQKVITQLKIMNMLQLMWKLNMSEVMWKTLEQTELKGQMIPKRDQMKLLQKVLLLPVSGQFGNHRWKTPGSLKEQETFCWFWSISWFLASLYSHGPFLGKGSKLGCAPSPVPHYGMAKCPPGACSSNIYSSSGKHTLVWGWASCYRRSKWWRSQMGMKFPCNCPSKPW